MTDADDGAKRVGAADAGATRAGRESEAVTVPADRADAAPRSDAERSVTTVPSTELPLQTRHDPDPAGATAGAPAAGLLGSHRKGPTPDHEGLDRGLAGLYGRDPDAPVWPLWLMGGAALAAGVLALFMPLVATLAATTLAAAMLLVSGIVGLIGAFRREGGAAIAAGVAVSVLSVVGGVLMLFVPLAGILAIATLIVAFLAASGVMKLWYAIRRGHEMPGRGWMIASGAVSLVLAAVLFVQLPVAALWLPGLVLALDLLMYGGMMLALAWRLSREGRTAAA